MRKRRVNHNTITVEYGSYEFDEQDVYDGVFMTTTPTSTISEFEFYKIYLKIKDLIGSMRVDGKTIDITLTPSCIELMAHIMTKGMDFNVNWKNNSQQLKDLAAELNRTSPSIYKSYVQLKAKKYFITTEDKLVLPNAEINKIRNRIKNHITRNGHASLDINFEFCVGDVKN